MLSGALDIGVFVFIVIAVFTVAYLIFRRDYQIKQLAKDWGLSTKCSLDLSVFEPLNFFQAFSTEQPWQIKTLFGGQVESEARFLFDYFPNTQLHPKSASETIALSLIPTLHLPSIVIVPRKLQLPLSNVNLVELAFTGSENFDRYYRIATTNESAARRFLSPIAREFLLSCYPKGVIASGALILFFEPGELQDISNIGNLIQAADDFIQLLKEERSLVKALA